MSNNMPQKIIDVDPSKPIASTVAELQLPPRPLIVLLGDFADGLNDQVRSICSRVIAPAALDPGALILDDARCSGCSPLIAQAALEQDTMPPLLGIIPSDRVATDIDANHELLLRLPPLWTDTAKYTFQIADQLIQTGAALKPAMALLFGGADAEKKSVVRCARRGWPVVVIKGTGGLADAILAAQTAQSNGLVPANLNDPDLREILETACICTAVIDTAPDDLNRTLLGHIDLNAVDTTLVQAWQRFTELDLTASETQGRFRWMQTVLATLAGLAALLAILSTRNAVPLSLRLWAHQHGVPEGTLHVLILLTAFLISVNQAYNSYFRDRNKWILLRGAAEALKREIFRFRARAGAYSDEQCLQVSRELKLAARLKEITSALEQSEVIKTNLLSVGPTDAAADKQRNTFLSPEEYVAVRLQDQVRYLGRKTSRLERQLRVLQTLIYVAGATGTFLAAIRLDVWVALPTALITALTSKLQGEQVEHLLMQYNKARVELRNIEVWWTALSRWEKDRPQNIDLLVDQTEKVLEAESAFWSQQMQTPLALEQLTEKERPNQVAA